jgi:hypothetical protein
VADVDADHESIDHSPVPSEPQLGYFRRSDEEHADDQELSPSSPHGRSAVRDLAVRRRAFPDLALALNGLDRPLEQLAQMFEAGGL